MTDGMPCAIFERRLAVILLAAATLLSSACCIPRRIGPAPEILEQEPLEVSPRLQRAAVFAFVAYTGELLEGSDDDVERQLAPCFEKELALQPLIGDDWELVWGPAVFKFEGASLDDNMMYVVRSTVDQASLVVGVRGTNARAILDWLVEDFEVGSTEAWEWTRGPTVLEPRISKGTASGLKILREMTPTAGIPGDELDLSGFLRREVEEAGIRSVTVTGHSLGGALAPALALWLQDTRGDWDSDERAEISVWGFAGPTPGDADFAAYYDERFPSSVEGRTSHRIHNPYDVVPLGWQADRMETIPGLYRPEIRAPFGLRELVCLAVDLTERQHYRQQQEDAPPIRGHLFGGVASYVRQAGCQHTCGYYRGLDLVAWDETRRQFVQRIKPITTDCRDFHPEPRCDKCPDWRSGQP